jgi:hypothetical protein
MDTAKEIASLNAIFRSYFGFFGREYCFSRDGRYLFVGGGTQRNWKTDPPLCAWELATSKKTMEFPVREILQCITVSPDGKLLATSTYSRFNVQIWDIEKNVELRRFIRDPSPQVSGIAFSPDSSCLAFVGQFPAVSLSDVVTGKDRWRILTLLKEGPRSVAFSPQGRMMAVGTASPKGGNVYLIETTTGLVRQRFEYGADKKVRVDSVAFSPNGLLLASAASDCAPLLWDVRRRILAKGTIKPLEPNELERSWRDLSGGDGAQAWEAILALEARPQQAVALLKQRMAPTPKLDAKRLAKLQKDLNEDSFRVRESAARQFEVLGQAAEPPLRRILASFPPVEVRKRVEKLLEKIGKGGLLSEELRSLRAHEVLESIASAEASKLLEAAATGEAAARVTQDARASLERMRSKSVFRQGDK